MGLPDLHPGGGIPVGAAIATRGLIHPHLIGTDIGCGMSLWRAPIRRSKVRPDRWIERLDSLETPFDGDVAPWLDRFGAASGPFDESLGTVGGGNHFVELQLVEDVADAEAAERMGLDPDRAFALIHSGSRGLGAAVLREHVAARGAVPLATEGPASGESASYLERHDAAMRWARANRALLAHRFLEPLGGEGAECLSDAPHNFLERIVDAGLPGGELAGEERAHGEPAREAIPAGAFWIHRKGAAPATTGPVVIPGSRGTFSHVVEPIGDGRGSLWSLAHGAGRRWTREETRARMRDRLRDGLRPSSLERSEIGSRVVCADRDLLLEQSPAGFKDVERVVGALVEAGLCRRVARLRPVITYKTREGGGR